MAQNTYIPKVETEALGVNTHPHDHKHIQTLPLDLSTKYTNIQAPDHKMMQTTPLNFSTKYTNTQTTDFASTQAAPSLNFQSNFARSLQNTPIEHMHVDEIEYNQP